MTHVAKALHAHIFSPPNHSLFFPSDGDAEPGPTLMEEAILHGFAKTEEEVLAINERRDDISGACAVAVVHQGDRLYVANLGDSRALIGRKKVKGSIIGRLTLAKASRVEEIETRERKKRVNLRVQHSSSFLKTLTQDKIRCTAVPLTRDLKAVASYERQRIIAAGGWIRRGRVFGVLAPSRSFGDPLEKGRMRGRKMRRGTVKGGEGRKVEEEERKAAEEAERKAAEQQAQEGGDVGARKEEGEGGGGEEEATSNEKGKRKKESNGSDEGEDEKPDDNDNDNNDDESDETASPAMPPRAVSEDSTSPQSEEKKEKEKDEKEEEEKEEKVEGDKKDERDAGHSNGTTSNGNGSSVGRVVPNATVSKEKTTESGTTTPTTKRAKNNSKGKNKKKSESEMKKLKGVREGVVIAVPEMTVHTLEPEDDFLVLATDGLWDVMDNKMVVDHVSPEVLKWRRLKEEEEREKAQAGGQSEGQRELNELRQSAADFLDNICRGLCKRAKRRGSRDDITVVIVIFDPLTTERSE